MLLAAKKTIRCLLMMLPNAADSLLQSQGVWHFSYLLELIDANHYLYASLAGNLFW